MKTHIRTNESVASNEHITNIKGREGRRPKKYKHLVVILQKSKFVESLVQKLKPGKI